MKQHVSIHFCIHHTITLGSFLYVCDQFVEMECNMHNFNHDIHLSLYV